MAKKTSTVVKLNFSERPKKKRVTVPEPVLEGVKEDEKLDETEEIIEDDAEYTESEIEEDEDYDSDNSSKLGYESYEAPKGSKENGITLCIVLFSILLVLMLGMIWQQASWRNWEEQSSVFVDPEYKGLSQVVKAYYTSMKDPNKEAYASEIRRVLSSVKSSAEPAENEQSITLSIQDILGFNKSKTLDESKYEYEWQGLFGSTGIIDSWLSNNNMEVTKSNQCKVYNAIAEGLK